MHWAPVFSNKPLKILFYTKEVWGVVVLCYIFIFGRIINNQLIGVVISMAVGFAIQYIVDRKPRGYLPHLAHRYGLIRLKDSPKKGEKYRN